METIVKRIDQIFTTIEENILSSDGLWCYMYDFG